MERANIFRQIVFKLLLDLAHHAHDFLGTLSEAQCRRRGNQPLATPNEEFRVKLVSKGMELETDGAWRQVNLFCCPGHARGVHDGEKQLELVDIHVPAPISARNAHQRAPRTASSP